MILYKKVTLLRLGTLTPCLQKAEHLGYIITPSKGWRAYKNFAGAEPFVSYTTEDEKNKLPKPGNIGWILGKRRSDFNSSNPAIWEEMLSAGLEQDLAKLFSYQPATQGIFNDSDLDSNEVKSEESNDSES